MFILKLDLVFTTWNSGLFVHWQTALLHRTLAIKRHIQTYSEIAYSTPRQWHRPSAPDQIYNRSAQVNNSEYLSISQPWIKYSPQEMTKLHCMNLRNKQDDPSCTS